MTHTTVPIEATQESISRPVALDVFRDLSRYINFRGLVNDNDIHFNLNGKATPIPGAKLNDHNENIRLPADAAFFISLDEEVTQDSAMVRPQIESSRYIFVDEYQKVYVKPIYVPVKAKLTIKIQADSRENAVNSYKQLMHNLFTAPSTFTHTIEYNIPIPNYTMQALIAIYDCIEVHDKSRKLGQYLKDHFNDSVTVITDLAGNRHQWAQKEIGTLIIGRFTHNADIPKPQLEDTIGQWSIETTYEYFYDRCDFVYMQHPISICQSLLPDRFLRIDQRIAPQSIVGQSSEFADAVGSWKFGNSSPVSDGWYFKQPHYDSWHLHYCPSDFDPIMSYLCGVDGQVESEFCNLLDVEHLELRDYLVKYLRATHDRLNVDGGSLIKVHVYSWGEIQSPDSYRITPELKVVSKVNQNVMDQWHVLIGFANDLRYLDKEYWAELSEHACFLRNYLEIYHPKWVDQLTSFDPFTCTADPYQVVNIVDEIVTGYPSKTPRTVNRLRIFAK